VPCKEDEVAGVGVGFLGAFWLQNHRSSSRVFCQQEGYSCLVVDTTKNRTSSS
jgi:hypothetical protein